MTTIESKQPSQEFMTALNELKPIWMDDSAYDIKWLETKYNSLIALGKNEGLSLDFVNSKLYERVVKCKGCNQEVIAYKSYDPLCPTCDDKNERQEWKENQEEVRKEEDPIEQYSNKILGIIPDYEISYEEQKKIEQENWEYRSKLGHEMLEREAEVTRDKPEGMTKKEWDKERRKKKRLLREEEKEGKANFELRYRGTPNHLIEKRIKKIPCDCTAEKMRQGIFCETCRLLVRVNEYMLDLFKDASEGRSTVV